MNESSEATINNNNAEDDFYVDFVSGQVEAPYLEFNNHGEKRRCIIAGKHQVAVCKHVFLNKDRMWNMSQILEYIREQYSKLGDDDYKLKNDSIKVVITAIDNINEKAVSELGLDEKLLFRNQLFQVGINPKYKKIVSKK